MLRSVPIILAGLAPVFGAGWDYPYDVTEWKKAAEVCGKGRSQSPIDLTPTTSRQKDLIKMKEDGVVSTDFVAYGGRSVGGHGIGFQVPAGHAMTLPDGSVYDMLQFHFHTGSEHFVDGKQFAAEVHYVHSRQGVPVSLIDGDLAVVGVNFELWDGEGDEPESVKVLDTLLNAVGFTDDAAENWPDNGKKAFTVDFNVEVFYDLVASDAYWTYAGSLTTPPCSEIVRWHVMMTPLKISQAQVELLESMSATPGSFRPPEPLHGRKVMPNNICGNERMKLKNSTGRIKKGRVKSACDCELKCLLESSAEAWSFKNTGKTKGRCDCFTGGELKSSRRSKNVVYSGLLA